MNILERWVVPTVEGSKNPVLLPDDKKLSRARLEEIAADDGKHILLLGGTGTGKDELARVIVSMSRRKDRLFKAYNCSEDPDKVRDNLYGHVKGAFTGAIADREGYVKSTKNGTLFLDEIGEMSEEDQGSLLRLLWQGEFTKMGADRPEKSPVRIIAATNKPERLRDELKPRFGWILELPPLSDRRRDIPMLVAGKCLPFDRVSHISIAWLFQLLCYGWPMNIRSLSTHVDRAILGFPTVPVGQRAGTLDASFHDTVDGFVFDFRVTLLAKEILRDLQNQWEKARLSLAASQNAMNTIHLLAAIWRSSRLCPHPQKLGQHPGSVPLHTLLTGEMHQSYDPSLIDNGTSTKPVDLITFLIEFSEKLSIPRSPPDKEAVESQIQLDFIDWIDEQPIRLDESDFADSPDTSKMLDMVCCALDAGDRDILKAKVNGMSYQQIEDTLRIKGSTAGDKIAALCGKHGIIKKIWPHVRPRRG